MIDKITSYFSRIFFFIAIALLGIAVLDWFLGQLGWTLSWINYRPGRLMEFAAILVLFVIVLVLRQIRELLKQK